MDYLVHDFYSMCNSLKRHSRTVFIDLGASLEFHAAENVTSPNGEFGRFDHLIDDMHNVRSHLFFTNPFIFHSSKFTSTDFTVNSDSNLITYMHTKPM